MGLDVQCKRVSLWELQRIHLWDGLSLLLNSRMLAVIHCMECELVFEARPEGAYSCIVIMEQVQWTVILMAD